MENNQQKKKTSFAVKSIRFACVGVAALGTASLGANGADILSVSKDLGQIAGQMHIVEVATIATLTGMYAFGATIIGKRIYNGIKNLFPQQQKEEDKKQNQKISKTEQNPENKYRDKNEALENLLKLRQQQELSKQNKNRNEPLPT